MKKLIISICLMFIAASGFGQVKNKFSPGDTLGIWHVINFDTTANYIHIDTSSQNLWQIGTPHKTFFNAAYSPFKGIVTDTINNYPANNHSWFDLYIGSFNFPYWYYPLDIYIDFWHKFETDTLKDGGYITVSWDSGQTWMNIIMDSVYIYSATPDNAGSGLYSTSDTLYNKEYGFSGSSNDWTHTLITWHAIGVKMDLFPPDTMIIRFNFISDSINNNKEGWMIDNIRLFSLELPGVVHEFYNSDNKMNLFPNPTTDNLTIKTTEKATIEIYNIAGQIIKTISTAEKQTSIDVADLSSGIYIIKAKTEKGVAVKKFVKQ